LFVIKWVDAEWLQIDVNPAPPTVTRSDDTSSIADLGVDVTHSELKSTLAARR
jgi:hypothetical protein